MLSIFPNLLTYGLVAPTLLRLVASVMLAQHGYHSTRMSEVKRRWAGGGELIAALLIFIGLWTQPAALIMAILILVRPDKQVPTAQRLLMVAILLSLLFTGPGFWAFDLPL